MSLVRNLKFRPSFVRFINQMSINENGIRPKGDLRKQAISFEVTAAYYKISESGVFSAQDSLEMKRFALVEKAKSLILQNPKTGGA